LRALATAGVGELTLIDFDKVSISNIHRQPLYSPEVVGEKKVEVARTKISALNPFIKVNAVDARISANNVESVIRETDLVIDCSDNLETKFLLHDACFKFGVPLVSASIYQFEGQVRTFVPRESGCLRCLSSNTPQDSAIGNCNDFGVLGSAVATIGSIQANEALLYLLEKRNNTTEETFFLNVHTLSQFKIKNHRSEECDTCAGRVEIPNENLEVNVNEIESPLIVDVRGQDDSLLAQYENHQEPVIIVCDRGIRSKRLVREMRARGHSNFYSLRGGACSL
jgi:sulfur-carrier protein adenylyltransferase/sulfurtransferase